MPLEIQVLTCDGHTNVVGFNWLRGSVPLWQLDLQWQYRYKQTIIKHAAEMISFGVFPLAVTSWFFGILDHCSLTQITNKIAIRAFNIFEVYYLQVVLCIKIWTIFINILYNTLSIQEVPNTIKQIKVPVQSKCY
jgi:hypothetical protein